MSGSEMMVLFLGGLVLSCSLVGLWMFGKQFRRYLALREQFKDGPPEAWREEVEGGSLGISEGDVEDEKAGVERRDP